MKKTINTLLSTLLVISLAGCSSSNSTASTETQESSAEPEETTEVTEVEETEEQEEVATLEYVDPTQELRDKIFSDDDYHLTSYAVTLGTYLQALEEEWDVGQLLEHEMSELLVNAYSGDATENIGFTFVDFNHDGVDELIIGAATQDGHPDNNIYDMYALVDGVETHVFSSSARANYYLTNLTDTGDAYSINLIGSSSASESDYVALNWTGTELEFFQFVRHDTDSETPWALGRIDDNGELVFDEEIDEQLGEDLFAAARAAAITPDYIPFSALK